MSWLSTAGSYLGQIVERGELRDQPLALLRVERLRRAGGLHALLARRSGVVGTLESGAELPAELTIVADPVRPDGVPEDVVPFLNQRAAGVFDGRYAPHTVTPPSFTLRLQRGTWRLRAEYVNYDRPNVPEPEFRNYVTAEVRREPDGATLPGSSSAGFELDVDRDLRITLVLRELPDADL